MCGGAAPGCAPGAGKINMLIFVGLILLICFGVLLLMHFWKEKQGFGVLRGNRIYQDTQEKPGVVLYAKSIPLCGKPDYLVQEKNNIFPVEVKTGKTPQYPYLNHIMQLMAYCYLVEEHYGIKVLGGYVRYPSQEFKIAYTEEARQSVIEVVQEIMQYKLHGGNFMCNHVEHNSRG
jgi:CRISPR-associated exonuclease Cas4